VRLLSTQTQDEPGQPPAGSANFSAVGRHAGTGHVLMRPQSRMMLGLNTLGLIVTLVNVSKNTKVESALERGYYVVDAFIYIIMLFALVLRDCLAAKPRFFSYAVYTAAFIYCLTQFVCRISFEQRLEQAPPSHNRRRPPAISEDLPRAASPCPEQEPLIKFSDITGNEDNRGEILIQTIMTNINSSTITLIGANAMHVILNTERARRLHLLH
jgi:hypothetical protein